MSNPQITAIAHIADRITKGLPDSGHDHTRKLYSNVARLALALESVATLNNTPSPTEALGAHAKRVMTAAAKLAESVTKARERLHEITREGLTEIDARIAQKVKLIPDGFAAEIRAQFRIMDSKAQFKLLGELVDKNRGPELAAIVKAPRILTGLDEEIAARYTQVLIEKHAPEEAAEQAALLAALPTALLAAETAGKAAQMYTDPQQLAAIEKGEAAAAAAMDAFINATA